MQHLYVYGVLIFEAMATFVGQVSVLSLIAIFGAATTTMVCINFLQMGRSHSFVWSMDL